MPFPTQVKIVEVSPRDGLQNERLILPSEIKVDFINRLSQTGLAIIETTSFVSPTMIPQLYDAPQVFGAISKKSNIAYPVLIPNVQGLELALTVGVKEIAVFTTPSEQFSQHNVHCSVAESMERIRAVMLIAKINKLWVRGYLSCVLGCPYEGRILPTKVAALAKELYALGCDEISLGDTIGVGTPFETIKLIKNVSEYVPLSKIAVHFHDTYGQALVNIYAALEQGVAIIDSSVAGLGGCPFAKSARGNVATEEVIYMLQGMEIETGIDLKKILAVAEFISEQLNRTCQSKVAIAMRQDKH